MIKNIICIVIIGIISVQEFDENLHKKCIYPTVKIADEKEQSGGTGFIVRSDFLNGEWKNIVLGAFHVIDGEENLWVYVGEYEQSKIQMSGRSEVIVCVSSERNLS
jgi:hypothetical protein